MLPCFYPWSLSLTHLHLFITKHPEMQIMALPSQNPPMASVKGKDLTKALPRFATSCLISLILIFSSFSPLCSLTLATMACLPTAPWTYQACSIAVHCYLPSLPSSLLGLYSNVTILERLFLSTLKIEHSYIQKLCPLSALFFSLHLFNIFCLLFFFLFPFPRSTG